MARVRKPTAELEEIREERRILAENDLEEFGKLVQPRRLWGNIHRELTQWITRPDGSKYQLVLLPRDHGKSYFAGLFVAWLLTKNPALRILLISSTSNLATKQLKAIKDILTDSTYTLYWPNMINKEEAKREKWTEREISIDHPLRKEWNIRDPSVFTAGLTSNIVGLHCDVAILDDVVVESNAYIEEGREKVKSQYSYLSSVLGADSRTLVVGTRYHPQDLYNDLLEIEVEEFDDTGNIKGRRSLYEVFERQVESVGDGSGEFLWPRQQGAQGKWFGFNRDILNEKRANYKGNYTRFRAQYYNDPHDIDSAPIKRDLFQYYDQGHLGQREGKWYFKGERLNVFAAVDFAFSKSKRADSSAIVVVGVDSRQNYYVLEIDRFKTDSPSIYFEHILKLHQTWGFRKIRAEVNVAQVALVKSLKEDYIRPYGLALSVDEYRPSKLQGAKEERIIATLEPKYANKQMWHYHSGNCQALEEELIYTNPVHDDIKDALASVVDFAQAPTFNFVVNKNRESAFEYNARFGGVA